MHNNLPLGHSVECIYLHTHHQLYENDLLALNEAFPNLHSFQGSFEVASDPLCDTHRLFLT